MCYYITATTAPNGDESAVLPLAKASRLKWEPLDNPGVLKQLHPGELYFLTTRGMCDFGTEIGVSIRTDGTLPNRDPDLSREIKMLKKKRWTENKMDRWIEPTKADAASTSLRLAQEARMTRLCLPQRFWCFCNDVTPQMCP